MYKLFYAQRIREILYWGASTSSECLWRKFKEIGTQNFNNLNWNGLAMVEFKKDDFGFKLIEINPKFGDLWVKYKIRINLYLIKLNCLNNLNRKFKNTYTVNRKFQWIFTYKGELDRLKTFKGDIFQFVVDLFNPKVKNELSLKDTKPNIIQIKA